MTKDSRTISRICYLSCPVLIVRKRTLILLVWSLEASYFINALHTINKNNNNNNKLLFFMLCN